MMICLLYSILTFGIRDRQWAWRQVMTVPGDVDTSFGWRRVFGVSGLSGLSCDIVAASSVTWPAVALANDVFVSGVAWQRRRLSLAGGVIGPWRRSILVGG